MRVGAVEDALGQLHQLAVSARAIGPPASAVCPLHGAASDGRHLHAFGTAGGSVVVQSLPTGGPATSVPETLAIVDTCDGGTCCDGSTARSVSKRQAVHHVAWDGKQVLAVAAGAQLQLLSLDGLLSRLQLSSTWPASEVADEEGDTASAPPAADSPDVQCIAAVTLDSPAVAVDWTQSRNGILVADAAGSVSMWQPWRGAGAPGAAAPGAAAGGAAQLRLLWRAQASAQQALVTAGFDVWSPAASSTGGPGQHVTVWWPQRPQDSAESTAPAQARAERLRQPAGVLSLQWSPSGLQQGAPQYEHLQERDAARDSAAAAAAAAAGEDEEGDRPESHHALLTVGGDNVLRFWVEVTLQPLLGSDGPLAPALEPHFCCTLVIELPLAGPSATCLGLQASWARPDSAHARGTLSRASSVQWVTAVGSVPGGADTLWLWAVDGLVGVVINGLPNQMGGSHLLLAPRAVLWGQHAFGPAPHPERQDARQVACRVTLEELAPVMNVHESWHEPATHESWHDPATHSAFLRSCRIDTVTEDSIASPRSSYDGARLPGAPVAPAVEHLAVSEVVVVQLAGHVHDVACVALHPGGQLAASVDAGGDVNVWDAPALRVIATIKSGRPYTQPVAEGGSGEGEAPSHAALAWLPAPGAPHSVGALDPEQVHAARPTASGAQQARHGAILAVGDPQGIRLFDVAKSDAHAAGAPVPGEADSARLLASAPLPAGCTAVFGLAVGVDTGGSRAAVVYAHLRSADAGDEIGIWSFVSAGGSVYGSTQGSDHLELAGRCTVASALCASVPREGISAAAIQRASCVTLLPHPTVQLAVSTKWFQLDGSISLYSLQRQRGSDQASSSAADEFRLTLVASVCCAEAPGPTADASFIRNRSGSAQKGLSSVDIAAATAMGSQQGAQVALSSCTRFLAAAWHGGVSSGSVGGSIHLWQLSASSDATSFSAAAVIETPTAPLALRWLDLGAPAPALLVCCATQGLLVYARQHNSAWVPVVRAQQSDLALVSTASPSGDGCLAVVAVGRRITSLTDTCRSNCSVQANAPPLGSLLAAASGPLPAYHPASLQRMLLLRQSGAAAASLRALLAALQQEGAPLHAAVPWAPLQELLDPGLLAWAATAAARAGNGAESARGAGHAVGDDGPSHGSGYDLKSSRAQAVAPGFDSGVLDMSAFGLPSHEPPAMEQQRRVPEPGLQQRGPASGFESGQLDMSAFGLPVPGPPAAEEGTQQGAASGFDSGMIDISAFGLAPPPQPAHSSQPASHSFESGELDMSAFGLPAPDPAPRVAQQQSAAASGFDSGMIDMSAFGMDPPPQATPPPIQPVSDGLASGQIDMSAFGLPAPEAAPCAAQQTATSSFDSGQIDMSAFGLLAPEPSPQIAQHSAFDSGQLDMSAFGMPTTYSSIQSAAQRLGTSSVEPTGRKTTAALSGTPARDQPNSNPRLSSTSPAAPPFKPEELAQLREQLGLKRDHTLLQLQERQGRPGRAPDRHTAAALFTAARLDDGSVEEAPGDDRALPMAAPGLTAEETAAALQLAELLLPDAGSQGCRVAPLDDAGQRALLRCQLAALQRPKSPAGGDQEAPMQTGGSSAAMQAGVRAKLLSQSSPAAVPQRWSERVGLAEGLDGSFLMWAFLSDTKEPLLSRCLELVPSELFAAPEREALSFSSQLAAAGGGRCEITWPALRAAGAGFWLSDKDAVRSQGEALARAQFAARRDPHDCALLYAALGKKSLLQGLFRTGGPPKLADFLTRNFNDASHRAAAAKNAFVLLGQHRYEMAAVFFILGGQLMDAVSVCAREMGDPQLALFLARILETPQQSLVRQIVQKELLPDACAVASPWGPAVLHWAAGERLEALQALLRGGTSPEAASGTTGSGGSEHELVVDFLRHSSSSLSAVRLWQGREQLASLAALVEGAAEAADMSGRPLAALQMLQVIQLCAVGAPATSNRGISAAAAASQSSSVPGGDAGQSQGGASEPSASLEGQRNGCREVAATAVDAWKARLAAACLTCRLPLLREGPTSAAMLPRTWREEATQQLRQLTAAGITLKEAEVFDVLDMWLRALHLSDDYHLAPPPRIATPLSASVTSSRPATPFGYRPGSARSGAGTQSGFSGGSLGGAGSPTGSIGAPVAGAVFHSDGWELARHGSRALALCCCNEGDYMAGRDGERRPLVLATAGVGLQDAELELPADALLDEETSMGSQRGSVFSSLVSQVFDAVRWPQASWEFIAPLPQPQHQQAGFSPASPLSPLSGSRFSRSLGSAVGAPPPATMSSVVTPALAAHPRRKLYLSGSAGGDVYLWQFGEPQALAAYTPLRPPPRAEASSAAALAAPTFTFTPASGRALATSASLSHWGHATAVRWSSCGDRLAAVGRGGAAATWRLDAPQSGGLAHADWLSLVLSKRGADIAFAGGGSSLLAVAGADERGGAVILVDTLAPAASARIARLHGHQVVARVEPLSGGRLLALGDEGGGLSMADLRMLGASNQGKPLWDVKMKHVGGVTAMAAGMRLTTHGGQAAMLLSGGNDGIVNVWSAERGTLLQSINTTPHTKGRGFFADALHHNKHAISGLSLCPEGVVVSTLEGAALFYPLS